MTTAAQDSIYRCYRIYSGEPAYDLCDVWNTEGSDLYIVSVATEWTNPEEVAAFQAVAGKLLASLLIK